MSLHTCITVPLRRRCHFSVILFRVPALPFCASGKLILCVTDIVGDNDTFITTYIDEEITIEIIKTFEGYTAKVRAWRHLLYEHFTYI